MRERDTIVEDLPKRPLKIVGQTYELTKKTQEDLKTSLHIPVDFELVSNSHQPSSTCFHWPLVYSIHVNAALRRTGWCIGSRSPERSSVG
jgi:hypothetical protein